MDKTAVFIDLGYLNSITKKLGEMKIDFEKFAKSFINPYNEELNEYIGLFLVTILRKLKWKYSFGRKAFQNKFTYEKIQLPIDKKGEPDWDFMEGYVKNLNYFD
jgi:hypothetical protein